MKHSRHEEIISIIGSTQVETQEELSELLRQRGYMVTQATISRDIREMRLIKVAGSGGKYFYAIPHREESGISQRAKNLLVETVEKVDSANNIAVIKTCAGMAQGAAAAVDSMRNADVVGSVAGDDTIIIVMRTNDAAHALCDTILEIVNGGR